MKSKQELQELRERGIPELLVELKEARNRLFQDRVRFATRNLDNSNPLRAGRKRVARILTLLRETELKETRAAVGSGAAPARGTGRRGR
jgi:ribosomal protein L29